jgi:hypothetical protein
MRKAATTGDGSVLEITLYCAMTAAKRASAILVTTVPSVGLARNANVLAIALVVAPAGML